MGILYRRIRKNPMIKKLVSVFYNQYVQRILDINDHWIVYIFVNLSSISCLMRNTTWPELLTGPQPGPGKLLIPIGVGTGLLEHHTTYPYITNSIVEVHFGKIFRSKNKVY